MQKNETYQYAFLSSVLKFKSRGEKWQILKVDTISFSHHKKKRVIVLLFLVYCVGEQIEFQFIKLVGIPKEMSSQEA